MRAREYSFLQPYICNLTNNLIFQTIRSINQHIEDQSLLPSGCQNIRKHRLKFKVSFYLFPENKFTSAKIIHANFIFNFNFKEDKTVLMQ